MTRPAATSHVLVDDERVRVTRFDFAPGAETGWHRHDMDYVVTPVTDCHFLLEEPGAKAGARTCPPARPTDALPEWSTTSSTAAKLP